jgi:predicted phosphodiesterase
MNTPSTTAPLRLAVLSDIHGNLAALEAVMADLRRRDVQRVVNLGDSLSGPLLPLETARLLMAQDWVQLAGNHERQLLTLKPDVRSGIDFFTRGLLGERELAWLATLVPRLPYGDDVLLCHGTPRSDIEYFLETVAPEGLRMASASEVGERLGDETAALILCGHTHIARSMRAAGGRLIVNPGSVGLPAYDDDLPYFHLVENGSPDARYAIVERRASGWHAELISVPYDHMAMARLAQKNGRDDYAIALETGYMPR